MVTTKKIESLELESNTLESYFDYINESFQLGQKKQTIQLIKALSTKQKKQAYKYFDEMFVVGTKYIKNLIVELI